MQSWTLEQLKERESELADDVLESEQILESGDGYVNRKCLQMDRRFLKQIRDEIAARSN